MYRWLTFCVMVSCAPLAVAEVRTERVEYRDGDVELAGHLAWDDAIDGPRPGVLVVHEWWGLNDYARQRVEQLADMGYVAFALDMYGAGKQTEHPAEARQWATQIRSNVDAWQSRAEAGLDVLRSNELVDRQRIAAIGYCFGGSTVLQMALSGADLRGVASFHGALPEATPEQAEQVQAKMLICHGAADGFVPEEAIDKFRATLEAADVDYMLVYYGGARHSFTVPTADEHGIDGLAYQAEADRRSWQQLQLFFDEIFSPPAE